MEIIEEGTRVRIIRISKFDDGRRLPQNYPDFDKHVCRIANNFKDNATELCGKEYMIDVWQTEDEEELECIVRMKCEDVEIYNDSGSN
jgi:hypothetical protein